MRCHIFWHGVGKTKECYSFFNKFLIFYLIYAVVLIIYLRELILKLFNLNFLLAYSNECIFRSYNKYYQLKNNYYNRFLRIFFNLFFFLPPLEEFSKKCVLAALDAIRKDFAPIFLILPY